MSIAITPRHGHVVGVVVAAAIVLSVGAAGSDASAARVIDPAGQSVDALDGVVVWTRRRGGESVLMVRAAGRVHRVAGLRRARSFGSLGLGLDRGGRIVAAYTRCNLRGPCVGPLVVDVLRGGERRLRLPVHTGCEPVKAVSVWRDRIAYVLRCREAHRGGVYVKAQAGRARRLIALSAAEAKYARVDLGPRLVAVASDTIGVRVASTGARTCQTRLDEVIAPPGSADFGSVQVTGGRVAWIRERLGAYGGGTVVLASAAVDPSCAVAARDATEVNYSLIDGFAVDGIRLYVSSEGRGVVAQSLGAAGR